MMSLPEVNLSSARLYQMLFSAVEEKLLTTSIRLEVYEHLQNPMSAAQLADALHSDPVNTEYFLNGLAACGVLEKQKGLYKNAPLAQTFLVKDMPTYLGEGFLVQSGMREMMASDLYKLVKEGTDQKVSQDLGHDEKKWGRFAKIMANNARAGIAQQAAELVSELPEFASFEKMLDLGGGPGIFGIAMVAKHPSMKGVVFDRKPSTDVAQKFIAEYQLQDRMEVLAGDYNEDAIGIGYDFIWASSTLNFAQPHLGMVINKIYDALNPRGLFINFSEGLTHEGTQPAFFVLCTMAWSMHNQPLRAFDQGEIADAMIKAGFKSVKSRTLDTGWGPMDLDIARK
jgi:hypothetical protein